MLAQDIAYCEKFPAFSPIDIEVPTLDGTLIFRAFRPDEETIKSTQAVAKAIFIEAFTTTYTGYFEKSGDTGTVETWLKLKEGVSIQDWLGATYDSEYQEFQDGTKGFIYLSDPSDKLIGWISHSPVSEEGDVYLSQCSLEADSRHKGVATTCFALLMNKEKLEIMAPGVKEIKLIVRRINAIAQKLYTRAGFTCDETIDPHVYGDSYDSRYVGYRLRL